MRKVIVDEWMSLDGVVQAPGRADEDEDGGFAHGGWHLRYFDELAQDWVVEGYVEPGGFLFGRRTYEILGAYWPTASEQEQVIARPRTRCRSTSRRARSPSRSNGRTRVCSRATSPRPFRP